MIGLIQYDEYFKTFNLYINEEWYFEGTYRQCEYVAKTLNIPLIRRKENV